MSWLVRCVSDMSWKSKLRLIECCEWLVSKFLLPLFFECYDARADYFPGRPYRGVSNCYEDSLNRFFGKFLALFEWLSIPYGLILGDRVLCSSGFFWSLLLKLGWDWIWVNDFLWYWVSFLGNSATLFIWRSLGIASSSSLCVSKPAFLD